MCEEGVGGGSASHARRQFEGSADRFLQSARPPLLSANETLGPPRH